MKITTAELRQHTSSLAAYPHFADELDILYPDGIEIDEAFVRRWLARDGALRLAGWADVVSFAALVNRAGVFALLDMALDVMTPHLPALAPYQKTMAVGVLETTAKEESLKILEALHDERAKRHLSLADEQRLNRELDLWRCVRHMCIAIREMSARVHLQSWAWNVGICAATAAQVANGDQEYATMRQRIAELCIALITNAPPEPPCMPFVPRQMTFDMENV